MADFFNYSVRYASVFSPVAGYSAIGATCDSHDLKIPQHGSNIDVSEVGHDDDSLKYKIVASIIKTLNDITLAF